MERAAGARLSNDDDFMHCNNYNYTKWHQLHFHTQSTFLNLSLLLHSCTQSSAAVPQRSNSHYSHFCIIILNITPSCLPATHHHLEEAAISGCRPSDWCLPQAGQTGVNVIFSSLFLSPNYVTPSGKLDHCPVLLHPIKGLVEREPRVTAALVATSSVPTVLPHQWSSGIAVETCCEPCMSFSVVVWFSVFQLSVVVWVHYFLSLPCLFITLSPVVIPPR